MLGIKRYCFLYRYTTFMLTKLRFLLFIKYNLTTGCYSTF